MESRISLFCCRACDLNPPNNNNQQSARFLGVFNDRAAASRAKHARKVMIAFPCRKDGGKASAASFSPLFLPARQPPAPDNK
jgi:hypothetical protein